jgi:hypothetical protein
MLLGMKGKIHFSAKVRKKASSAKSRWCHHYPPILVMICIRCPIYLSMHSFSSSILSSWFHFFLSIIDIRKGRRQIPRWVLVRATFNITFMNVMTVYINFTGLDVHTFNSLLQNSIVAGGKITPLQHELVVLHGAAVDGLFGFVRTSGSFFHSKC